MKAGFRDVNGDGALCPVVSPRNPVSITRSEKKRKHGADNPRLFVFLGLFGDFVAGMRHILAGACYGVASAEESRRAEKNDKTGERDC